MDRHYSGLTGEKYTILQVQVHKLEGLILSCSFSPNLNYRFKRSHLKVTAVEINKLIQKLIYK